VRNQFRLGECECCTQSRGTNQRHIYKITGIDVVIHPPVIPPWERALSMIPQSADLNHGLARYEDPQKSSEHAFDVYVMKTLQSHNLIPVSRFWAEWA
jgi:hypothetical protein